MHAFDQRYVKDGKIVVRNAKDGETITTLDGQERQLSPEMLIIADAEKPIAVAGVMGGEYSGIMDDTNTVIFESAYFEPVQVRRTAKKLGMRTDASARYEKGLDPDGCPRTLKRAMELVELLGAGEPVAEFIEVDNRTAEPVQIPFDPDWINRFLGTEISRMCPFGEVYAVEYKPEALDILEQNKTRFQTENLQIVAGRAEEQVQHLPVPDCVFLGGSSGAAKQLVAGLRQLRQPVRLVASAVTMETQAELFPLLQELPQFEVVQLAVGCGKTVGNYHVLEGNHPVLLFSCMTKE